MDGFGKHILLIFLMVLTATPSFSQVSSLTTTNKSCLCDSEVADPLEEPQSFNFGKFQGRCIDSCRFRPARILDEKKLVVGNVLHFGSFYKGSIPWQQIGKIEAGFEEFVPGIFHVFLKFTIKDDAPSIQLVNQLDPAKPGIETRTLVISSEGVPPKDHKYSLFESYFGHYLLAHRLVTGEELSRWILEYKHPVKLVTLNIEPAMAGQILVKGIKESHKTQLQNVYQLFSNNCSTTALSFIDSVIGGKADKTKWDKLEEALPVAGPIGTLRYLESRKLVR